MEDFKHIQYFYFLGIGGIGMSALARYLKRLNKNVLGYDKTKTTLTNQLEEEGINITYIDQANTLNKNITPSNTLIIYTPAIPQDNLIGAYFEKNNFPRLKRAQFLGILTKNSFCLAVAGTHGKTTTSAILGHLLTACNMPVTAFLGGIAENYNSNFIFNGNEISVVEADEFDRSFLQLKPNVACVTSMDADHLDIYSTPQALQNSFIDFSNLIENKYNLLHKKGLPLNGQSVAIEDAAMYEAQNVKIIDGFYHFDLKTPNHFLTNLVFALPGHHNLQNAVTALGMALLAGAPVEKLPSALASFKGVQRRFSYRIKSANQVLIDDYAHHPTEINALYQAVTEMYPNQKKVIVFQPHLYSRTRDFADAFAEALAQFDEVLLLPIYPARELPIDGVTSQWLLQKINHPKKQMVEKDNMYNFLKATSCSIKLLVGAGDIGEEVPKLTKMLSNEN